MRWGLLTNFTHWGLFVYLFFPVQLPDFPQPAFPVALDIDRRRRHRRVSEDLLRDVERNVGCGAVHAEGVAQRARVHEPGAGIRAPLPSETARTAPTCA